MSSITLTPRADGRLKVYQEPNPGDIYALGADVAEGLELGDFSSVFVINKRLEHCASWHGKMDPDLFGELVCKIGSFYNQALVAVEINNHGHATMAQVKRKGYLNVYTRQIKEERSEAYTKKIGWHSNKKSKMLMLDEFVAAVREGTLQLWDQALLREMMTLVIEPGGDILMGGKDRVVAACIALQAIKQAHSNDWGAIWPAEDIKRPANLREKLKLLEKKSKRARGSQFE